MTPEHFQLIISDLYEENYKSNFAKDLRENIDDLIDFDWIYHYKFNDNIGGGICCGGICCGGIFGVGTVIGSGDYVGGISESVGGWSDGSFVGGNHQP